MSWGGPSFVLIIIAISTIGWVVNNWIRARHGYALEDEWSGKTQPGNIEADRQVALLTNENADLKGKILRIEERVAVLERIATDKSHRLSDEIDSLR
ncbi:MAG: hypothetical protein AABZ45_07025 [Pseudomonadota bacterium]